MGTPRPMQRRAAASPTSIVGQLAFLASCRSATLATLSPAGQARLVPICFVLAEQQDDSRAVLYSPLDEKPKRGNEVRDLARVRDILARPSVTLLFDRWSEDWSRLAWLRVQGTATLVEPGDDVGTHQGVIRALRERYPQYQEQAIDTAPLIRIVVQDMISWGDI